ncbi:MAG: tRNA 4-thiouridine(8) synthase ThiI [Ruminococcaceae bacterium]|nr:tRNA 4-thiouridine(8) synthase ThiI [Oscillospiraceae bacterium]
MKEIILCKYGEIVLKGLNRGFFENMLISDLKKRVAPYGNFSVTHAQSTAYIEPLDDEADIDGAIETAKKVFGFVSIIRAAVAKKELEDIMRVAADYIPQFLAGARSFRAEAKRADKNFPMKSPELAANVGGAILSVMPKIKVDLNKPDVTVRVEIRENGAYIHAGGEKGAGGIPVGSAGKAMLLLSGGIDSPVAGYMMAKRGAAIEAVHFESFPYTSERAKEKVLELAKEVTEYSGKMKVNVISLTKIQETLVRTCDEEYFTLLLRRFMMRLSERVARRNGAMALITGESLGQVASQTMQALGVTDNAVNLPVFRPCIGMDKEEIIEIARKIGTFDTSILPFEDCCTVFTPKHPKTRPDLEKVLEQEKRLNIEELEEEAFATLDTIVVCAY